MSKSFIMGLAFCFAATGVLHADVQFGLKGGLGLSDISSSSSMSKSGRVGLQFGGVLIQKVSDNFSLQYEALYSQKGVQSTQTIDANNFKTEINLDYLEVPVLAKFKVDKTWSVYAGGYAGLAISRKLKLSINSVSSGEGDLDKITNSLDYGMLLGAQAQITDKWGIDARYNLGLTDVFKSDKGNIESKNSTISLAATYLL